MNINVSLSQHLNNITAGLCSILMSVESNLFKLVPTLDQIVKLQNHKKLKFWLFSDKKKKEKKIKHNINLIQFIDTKQTN